MPDADIVHEGLGYRHQKVYMQICEGGFDPEYLASVELKAQNRDIRGYGNPPIELIQKATALFQSIPSGLLLRSTVPWAEIGQQLEKLKQQVSLQSDANKRGIELAYQACKTKLNRLRRGEATEDLTKDTLRMYMTNAYEANFEDPVHQPRHYNDADSDLVDSTVAEMRPFIEQGLSAFAEQAARHGRVDKLRRPSRKRKSLDLDYDLL